jgi:hypothetical protein
MEVAVTVRLAAVAAANIHDSNGNSCNVNGW